MPDDATTDSLQTVAELRRELAQARAERDEALARETAAAEVLRVINASPGDLAPVFDAMLERAMRLCGGAFGVFAIFEGEHYRVAASRGLPPRLAEFVRDPIPIQPGSMPDRLRRGEATIQIPDLATLGPEHRTPGLVAMIESGKARTALWIGLRKDGVAQGFFGIYRQEVRPFTDKQIALLQNFAAQAVIAMENARLITETREALEQQTATAEVLGVINSSPGDLAPVFDAMLEKALHLCEAAIGTLYTYDGELMDAVAIHGASAEYVEYLQRGPFRPGPGALGRLTHGEQLVHFADLTADEAFREAYRSGNPHVQAVVDLGKIRSNLCVSLRKDGVLLGAIAIYRHEVRPFTDKQIALLQNFAAQAVIAMENARLITETREALEQQTATAEVLEVINSSPGDLAPVFDTMLEKATTLCDAPSGQLAIYDGEFFRFVAAHGDAAHVHDLLARGTMLPVSGTTWPRIVAGEHVVHIPDVMESEHYRAGHENTRRFVEVSGGRSLLTVALRKDNVLMGALSVYRRHAQPFSDKQIALLQNFAAQAVIAMENARLITETREALEQQTATAEVLGVINSSPGDLAPVFDAMLEKALRLCEASLGILYTYDGQSFQCVRHRGVSAEVAEFLQEPRGGNGLVAGGAFLRLLTGEEVIHETDLANTEAYRRGIPLRRALVDLDGAQTLLYVALRSGTHLLGTVVIYRKEVRLFTSEQIALLQNFAAQAVIAMENARLITETREALEQQTATAEVLQVINSSPGDLAPVFDAMLEKAHTLCGAAHGTLTVTDGEYRRAVATRGMPEAFAEVLRQPFQLGPDFQERLLSGDGIVHIADITAREFSSDNPVHRAAVDLGGVRTLLMVPLRKDGVLLGYFTANRQEVRPFTDKQVALLQTFAAQAVIAMENARLLGELRERTEEVAGWNRELEARVAAQLAEIERTGKLRRFLAPQLAELILARGDESILESHRREIVVAFCDVRGFTGFAERAEPEEVMAFLREYHAALGPIVARFEGTLDHYSGDGIMVFFNDPLPTPEPAKRAIAMAVAMREAAQELLRAWRRHGHDLGFGVGISQGYATLGQIGFAERMDYTAIGTVCNLAARLCGEAKDGQILISRRIAVAVEDAVTLEEIGELPLRGLSQPVGVYNVAQ